MAARTLSGAELDQLRRQNAVLWARLAGHPGWAARFCTPDEETQLNAQKGASSKVKQVAVCFFGHAVSLAWLNEASVLPFQLEPTFLGASGSSSSSSSASTFQYAYCPNRQLDFDEKRFRDRKDYRSMVLEACRMQIYRETGARCGLMLASSLGLASRLPGPCNLTSSPPPSLRTALCNRLQGWPDGFVSRLPRGALVREHAEPGRRRAGVPHVHGHVPLGYGHSFTITLPNRNSCRVVCML